MKTPFLKPVAGLIIGAAVNVSPWGATPVKADGASATTVFVAAATAGLTAVATYVVKDYFEGRSETKRVKRETEEALRDAARLEKTAAALEAENEEWRRKITLVNEAASFWTALIFEDEDFFKPPRPSDKVLAYERGLEMLYIKRPELVAKISTAMKAPAGEYERYLLLRAYGSGLPGADFGELARRVATGLEGGVVRVAGEEEPRYVSGAENLIALVDYVKDVAGEEYPRVLQRFWGLTDDEMDAFFAVFPQ